MSYPNATLAPQAMQARASGENLNYATLAPQASQARASDEILNYLLSRYSDILKYDHGTLLIIVLIIPGVHAEMSSAPAAELN